MIMMWRKQTRPSSRTMRIEFAATAATAAMLVLLIATATTTSSNNRNAHDHVRPVDNTVAAETLVVGVRNLGNFVVSKNDEPPAAATTSQIDCPPAGFDALPVFDIDLYISELWYPQAAAPVVYAPGQSYCSVVHYTKDTSCRLPFFCNNKARINVNNRGTSGLNGPLNQARLKAYVPNANTAPAKIRVGPWRQYLLSQTNYWVVAADAYDQALAGNISATGAGVTQYDWALITGASPTRPLHGACAPGAFGALDTRGLWIFTRHAQPPPGVVAAVAAHAALMGLDTSILISVIHDDCTYDFLNVEEDHGAR